MPSSSQTGRWRHYVFNLSVCSSVCLLPNLWTRYFEKRKKNQFWCRCGCLAGASFSTPLGRIALVVSCRPIGSENERDIGPKTQIFNTLFHLGLTCMIVTVGVNGEFLHFGFVSDISATRRRIHTKFCFCRDNVCRRAPSPSGVHRPLGTGGGGVKTQKMGGLILPFLFFSALPSVVQYVAHRPAHILL